MATPAASEGPATGHGPDLQRDALVMPAGREFLARGLALKKWWTEVEAGKAPPIRQFPIERSFNRPTRAFGFYGEAPVAGRMMPVMGNVQEMFYDQTRAPASMGRDSAEWMWAQIREFVMKYFMRISSLRRREVYVDAAYPLPPPALARLSWCPAPQNESMGFGFSQLFYKPAGAGKIDAFPSYDQSAIVDQREVGKKYDWLVLKVRIFDFNFAFHPLGESGPAVVFGEDEESYLVVHEQFVNHKDHPAPGVLGDYGIGYAFIKSPTPGPFRYGPGEFEAALELINFRVYETGYISVRMVFIANRPAGISNLAIDPVDWGFRVADLFSLGLASRVLSPAKQLLRQHPFSLSLDPVRSYISGANLITRGYAANNLCISTEQLEKYFLLLHFRQHYQTVVDSLLTWRLIPDWLYEKNLPSWIISGVSL